MLNLKKSGLLFFFTLNVLSLGFVAPAYAWIDVVNPRTYYSPTKEFSLYVNPSDWFGWFSGDHIFKKSDEVLWEKNLSFTLYEVKVMNDGTIVGYAYDHGLHGSYEGPGNLYLVIMNKKGELLLQEKIIRKGSRGPELLPDGIVSGIDPDEINDRMIFEVSDPEYDGKIVWWIYRLSTGEKLAPLLPQQLVDTDKEGCFPLSPRFIPQTPLTLVQWKCYKDKDGAKFALMDLEWNALWELSLPDDYEVFKERKDRWNILAMIREKTALLSVDDYQFSIWTAKTNERVSFFAKQDKEGKWIVEEEKRENFDWIAANKTEQVEVKEEIEPRIKLEYLGVEDVSQEEFQERGYIGNSQQNVRARGGDYSCPDSFDHSPVSYVVPGTNKVWIECRREVLLTNNGKEILKLHKRHANGDWLEYLTDFVVAVDGSVLVVSDDFRDMDITSFSVFNAAGEGEVTFSYSQHDVFFCAYSGEYIALSTRKAKIEMRDRTGQLLGLWNPKEISKASQFFFSKDGTELIIFEDKARVHRYKISKI